MMHAHSERRWKAGIRFKMADHLFRSSETASSRTLPKDDTVATDPRRPRAVSGGAHRPQDLFFPFALPENETVVHETSTQLALSPRLVPHRLCYNRASQDAFVGIREAEIQTPGKVERECDAEQKDTIDTCARYTVSRPHNERRAQKNNSMSINCPSSWGLQFPSLPEASSGPISQRAKSLPGSSLTVCVRTRPPDSFARVGHMGS